jgi:protein-histidine N-methyltransferase
LPNLLLAALPFLSEVDDSPGHLEITDDVKQSFKSLLAQKGIELEFSHGDWAGLSKSITTYDLVLTAETIYSEESVDDLISVLKASGGVILVAAKVLYFGVGGGLGAFLQKVEQQGGHSEGVKEWTKGVGRKVVRIKF